MQFHPFFQYLIFPPFFHQERIIIKDKKFNGEKITNVADNVAVINAVDKTAILEKAEVKQISLVTSAGENKDEEVEVKVTLAQLNTTQPIDSMIQSGQVQTSVNGLTIQNGLTTNMVSAKAATGEEVPEQVIDAEEINDTKVKFEKIVNLHDETFFCHLSFT